MLYLGWDESGTIDADAEGPWVDLLVLRPGLILIDSTDSRSVVYHALKHHCPPGTGVLVAPLADDPKLSRLAPGATKWLRQRGGSSP